MGILKLFLQSPEEAEDILERHRDNIRRAKSDTTRYRCKHEITYEKWIYEGPKQGVTFHFKEVCKKCGYARNIKRTKEVFEIVKKQKWHRKKR